MWIRRSRLTITLLTGHQYQRSESGKNPKGIDRPILQARGDARRACGLLGMSPDETHDILESLDGDHGRYVFSSRGNFYFFNIVSSSMAVVTESKEKEALWDQMDTDMRVKTRDLGL
ncbi:hypothetical protein BJ138DRAFT_1095811 [Hygrophoropsis aurantiaca]|uniref:Uncharacterized protein n=1 Tax=Hygrophoropsis aurantiaca TaxID=72124 RepID=A0ACB7ZTH5_9AGAM|nr:hypothetical protein BJ138DRAFT_1095811 [Hygrophoropsis aurantiaca]